MSGSDWFFKGKGDEKSPEHFRRRIAGLHGKRPALRL